MTLSSPVEHSLHSSIPLQNVLVGESDDVIPPPATLYLQMGKRTVKRIPDAVLLGALVVISTELLQVDLYHFFAAEISCTFILFFVLRVFVFKNHSSFHIPLFSFYPFNCESLSSYSTIHFNSTSARSVYETQ